MCKETEEKSNVKPYQFNATARIRFLIGRFFIKMWSICMKVMGMHNTNRTKNELYISFNKYFDRKVEYKPYVVNKITLGNGWSIEKLSTTFELLTYICPNVLSTFKALSYAIQSCNINDILFISNRLTITLR